MFVIRGKEDVQSAAPVLKGLAALYKEERQSVPVTARLTVAEGKPATLLLEDRDGHAVETAGTVPQQARTAPTTPERAASALGKTGGTPYTICNIVSEIDDGLMIPASGLNAMRREALERLTALRGAPRPHPYTGEHPYTGVHPHADGEMQAGQPYRAAGAPKLRVRIARAEQLTAPLAEADEIVVPAGEFDRCDRELLARHKGKLLVEIPGIVFDGREKLDGILQNVIELGVTRGVVGGLGGIDTARRHGFSIHGDYGLNIANTPALEEYRALGLADATVSFELGLGQIRDLGGTMPRGMLAWGHLPLMATRNCPAGNCGGCNRKSAGGDPAVLTDRKGNRFFLDCVWQVPRLYNCVPLFLADRLKELPAVDFLTLYFTRERPEECADILALYRRGGGYDRPMTRGLYYRKVL